VKINEPNLQHFSYVLHDEKWALALFPDLVDLHKVTVIRRGV